MRVLLVDDHQLMWNGTRLLLESVLAASRPGEPLDFEAARDVATAAALAPPDLVLLDYHLPGQAGLDALHAVRAAFEGVPVCMLSAESDTRRIHEVLAAGAVGFIPKSYAEPAMADALRRLVLHGACVPPEFLLSEEVVRSPEADEVKSEDLAQFLRHELSPRQRQALRLALQGLPNKLIARRLGIAEGTVKVHLSMVYRALGVHTRVAALCRVLQAGAEAALDESR